MPHSANKRFSDWLSKNLSSNKTFIVIALHVPSVYPSHLQFSMLAIRADLVDTWEAGLLLWTLSWSLPQQKMIKNSAEKKAGMIEWPCMYFDSGGKGRDRVKAFVFKTWWGVRQNQNECVIELCLPFSKAVFPCLQSNPFISTVPCLIFKWTLGIIIMHYAFSEQVQLDLFKNYLQQN